MNEAELLFTEMLNCSRLSLYLNKESPLDKDKSVLISSALRRRLSGEPIQYILGKTEFMGLEFKVDRRVFIPRPETEILVESIIKLVSGFSCQVSGINILDLGTGSGNIAISLAKYLPKAQIYATDICGDALEIARINARLNHVDERIKFIQADLFTAYSLQFKFYDVIVSNPPYIPSEEIKNLAPEIRYEPSIALDGGRDGLDFYRQIINEARAYLKEEGFLLMEIGFNQKEPIKKIFQKAKFFQIIDTIKDYNNIDRLVLARKKRQDG